MRKYLTYSYFTLLIALGISTVAAYYSIIGLTAIFAAAFVPIVVMGLLLEVAKITTSVWLQKYWHRAEWYYKYYLVSAVVGLAFLTSMGIFGYLSKAHIDQGVPTSDVAAQIALLDEKIKTERDNIDTAKKALQQMDSQVDQLLSRGTTEQNAERAVQIRRQQGKERTSLQNDITKSQATIKKLNEERAPIASQLRQVEAEVGPIKFIAALIYGDNPDADLLERAVRWVIMLIVIVFDPLAIILVLAANKSVRWEQEEREQALKALDDQSTINSHDYDHDDIATKSVPVEYHDSGHDLKPDEHAERVTDYVVEKSITEVTDTSSTAESDKPEQFFKFKPTEVEPMKQESSEPVIEEPKYEPDDGPLSDDQINQIVETAIKPKRTRKRIPKTIKDLIEQEHSKETEILTRGVTIERELFSSNAGYVTFEGKQTSIEALKSSRPDLIHPSDRPWPNKITWGATFPDISLRGDIHIITKVKPHRVYKFNMGEWIEQDKLLNTAYLADSSYIEFLIKMLEQNYIAVEQLTEHEQEEIANFLKS